MKERRGIQPVLAALFAVGLTTSVVLGVIAFARSSTEDSPVPTSQVRETPDPYDGYIVDDDDTEPPVPCPDWVDDVELGSPLPPDALLSDAPDEGLYMCIARSGDGERGPPPPSQPRG